MPSLLYKEDELKEHALNFVYCELKLLKKSVSLY